jgi:putative aldouronate transport system substrate-binding protein
MTDVNPYPEHTMAFVDRFYTLENSVQAQFGFAPEGIMQVDGVWVPQPIDPERRAQIATAGTFPSIFREEDFGPNLAMDTTTQFLYNQYYEHYVRFKAKEQWVRAEFASDEQTEANTLRTDIEKLWKTNQARWITGAGDIDREWDAYVQQMKNMGIDRYVELHHAAHSRFLNEVGDYR